MRSRRRSRTYNRTPSIGRPIGILIDLQGPKLRIGAFAKGPVTLARGDEFTLDSDPAPGDATRVQLPHKEILGALRPGHVVLIDDGKVKLHIVEATPDKARAIVDEAERQKLYWRFQEIFAEELPALPLYYPVYTYGVSKRVNNVQIGALNHPAERFETFNQWYIDSRRVPENQAPANLPPTPPGPDSPERAGNQCTTG